METARWCQISRASAVIMGESDELKSISDPDSGLRWWYPRPRFRAKWIPLSLFADSEMQVGLDALKSTGM